jgi:methylenetetrahydrofolate reductase (NADPH)
LEAEKKPQRLERAALMVAAARGLGFAGAHIGGFGMAHRDFQTVIERAAAIGQDWRGRMDELVFASPGDFYLFREGQGGLSDGASEYQTSRVKPRPSFAQRLSAAVHDHFIKDGSIGARFFASRLKAGNHDGAGRRVSDNFWSRLLAPSVLYRKATLGCVSCGDCLQDHLNYAGCSMRRCYKELRNGPCGGSRVDGSCEARAEMPCVWNLVYQGTLGMGDDPEKFACVLVPPRDWALDQTNALANRFAGVDNYRKRTDLAVHREDSSPK